MAGQNWNLLLKKTQKGLELIMPNENGVLETNAKEGFLIHWPVNPHFTGKGAILLLLSGYDKFKNLTIY